jgi:hypothetical protein
MGRWIGGAPCVKCDFYHDNIVLVPGSREPDGCGGWWIRVATGQACENCGEPFQYFHVPAPIPYPFAGIEVPVRG